MLATKRAGLFLHQNLRSLPIGIHLGAGIQAYLWQVSVMSRKQFRVEKMPFLRLFLS